MCSYWLIELIFFLEFVILAYKWLCEFRTCIFAVSLRSSSSLESKGSSIEMLCGNAIWPKEGGGFVNGNGGKTADPSDLVSKPWRPLTRKLKIPAAVISPYRYSFFSCSFLLSTYCPRLIKFVKNLSSTSLQSLFKW